MKLRPHTQTSQLCQGILSIAMKVQLRHQQSGDDSAVKYLAHRVESKRLIKVSLCPIHIFLGCLYQITEEKTGAVIPSVRILQLTRPPMLIFRHADLCSFSEFIAQPERYLIKFFEGE
ncbi:hypothetical protein AN963_08845 [Brevibacillus choshinensis]|uniref:Uncharacterized protein n=1 Tax=Brevibacillus choshinensis TaxID=54911 RepID=A0ABR5NE56_BRECH|nr:hypothetical protein AN963_08845 [Brevibacillus choshinensis]